MGIRLARVSAEVPSITLETVVPLEMWPVLPWPPPPPAATYVCDANRWGGSNNGSISGSLVNYREQAILGSLCPVSKPSILVRPAVASYVVRCFLVSENIG